MPAVAGLRPRQPANGFRAISSADSSAGLDSWGDATARGARSSLCPRLYCLTPLAYGMRDGHGAFSGGAGKNSRLNLPPLAPRRDAAICHCSRTGGEPFLATDVDLVPLVAAARMTRSTRQTLLTPSPATGHRTKKCTGVADRGGICSQHHCRQPSDFNRSAAQQTWKKGTPMEHLTLPVLAVWFGPNGLTFGGDSSLHDFPPSSYLGGAPGDIATMYDNLGLGALN